MNHIRKLVTAFVSICFGITLIYALSSCRMPVKKIDFETESGSETESKTESKSETETETEISIEISSEPQPQPELQPEISSEFYKPVASSYAYEQLSQKEQVLYTRMKDALLNYAPGLEGNLEEYIFEQINKVIKFVLLDHPEIFWANEGGTTYTSELNGVKTTTKYEFKYILGQSQKNIIQNQINSAVNDFLENIAPGLSEYERTLAVYEYLIEIAEYDTAIMNKIVNGIKDDSTELSQTIASVFIDKKTVCSGYSKATQYLLNKLGIFCAYVSGGARGQGDNHAWNVVRIEGDYYFLDTTWGNPVNIDPAREKRMTYNYFCLTSGEFSRSHTPNDDIKLPDCTATKYNYFVYNNLLLNEYDPARIGEILKNAAIEKQKGVNIKFSSEYAAEKAIESLFGDDKEIFDILDKIAYDSSELDASGVSYSFDPDVCVIYIEPSYK